MLPLDIHYPLLFALIYIHSKINPFEYWKHQKSIKRCHFENGEMDNMMMYRDCFEQFSNHFYFIRGVK